MISEVQLRTGQERIASTFWDLQTLPRQTPHVPHTSLVSRSFRFAL